LQYGFQACLLLLGGYTEQAVTWWTARTVTKDGPKPHSSDQDQHFYKTLGCLHPGLRFLPIFDCC